jgi:hypothetical protein
VALILLQDAATSYWTSMQGNAAFVQLTEIRKKDHVGICHTAALNEMAQDAATSAQNTAEDPMPVSSATTTITRLVTAKSSASTSNSYQASQITDSTEVPTKTAIHNSTSTTYTTRRTATRTLMKTYTPVPSEGLATAIQLVGSAMIWGMAAGMVGIAL